MTAFPLGRRQIASIEKRANEARKTMGEVCELAGIAQSTWSRAKARGTITTRKIGAIESALDTLENKAGPDGQSPSE